MTILLTDQIKVNEMIQEFTVLRDQLTVRPNAFESLISMNFNNP